MPHIKQFDHIGITVADLDPVTAFFADLGLEVDGRTFVNGEFIDTVIGIPDSRRGGTRCPEHRHRRSGPHHELWQGGLADTRRDWRPDHA